MIGEARAMEIVGTPEVADALRKYKYVTGTLFHTDASDDYTYQKEFCLLYKMDQGYSEKFMNAFFSYMEKMKAESGISFRDALEEFQKVEGKNEMVAASLLVHTVNPRFPIWNPELAMNLFGIKNPEEDASIERCCKVYEDFSNAFYAYASSPEGNVLVHAFDAKFPSAEVPEFIKVAFIVWGDIADKAK